MNDFDYVLLTSAFNEEALIERTLSAVVNQEKRPIIWLCISDTSTDNTDEIIRRYAEKYDFIRYHRVAEKKYAAFGSKAAALNLGISMLRKYDYRILGILDGDIEIDPDYYARLTALFEQNSRLGLAGGHIHEVDGQGNFPQKVSFDSVAGAVQTYRRECLEAIGSFPLLEAGGEDAVMGIQARALGWEVSTIRGLPAYHNGYSKPVARNKIKRKLRWGLMFYRLGYHPLFFFMRCLSRVTERPVIIGSFFEFFGYLKAWLGNEKVQLPPTVVKALQAEQKSKLWKVFKGLKK